MLAEVLLTFIEPFEQAVLTYFGMLLDYVTPVFGVASALWILFSLFSATVQRDQLIGQILRLVPILVITIFLSGSPALLWDNVVAPAIQYGSGAAAIFTQNSSIEPSENSSIFLPMVQVIEAVFSPLIWVISALFTVERPGIAPAFSTKFAALNLAIPVYLLLILVSYKSLEGIIRIIIGMVLVPVVLPMFVFNVTRSIMGNVIKIIMGGVIHLTGMLIVISIISFLFSEFVNILPKTQITPSFLTLKNFSFGPDYWKLWFVCALSSCVIFNIDRITGEIASFSFGSLAGQLRSGMSQAGSGAFSSVSTNSNSNHSTNSTLSSSKSHSSNSSNDGKVASSLPARPPTLRTTGAAPLTLSSARAGSSNATPPSMWNAAVNNNPRLNVAREKLRTTASQ